MNELSPVPEAAIVAPSSQAMIYTSDQDAAGVIRQALSDLGSADTLFKSEGLGAALTDMGNRPSPHLLIVDASGDDDPVSRVRDLINMCEPSTAVVVIGDVNDIRLYRSIREAGAAEYFFKPLVTAMVAHTCHAILTGKEEAIKKRTGRIVFVVGARGGCGATTIAVRTAMRLSEAPPRPVLMLDLDLRCGDSALQFDVTPSHALREALAQSDRVDDLFLERGLIHATKRLDLMASLEPLDAKTDFDETALMALLDKVTGRYRYVVVDVPAHRVPALNQSLHMPSTLLLISDGRLVSAREVARWRAWLGVNTVERTFIHLLNMNGAPGCLSPEDFARAAGAAPDVVIPYAREVGADALLGLKAKPECPTLDHGLEPVLSLIAGSAVQHKQTFLQRLLGRA
jgi:pilus assembly protein CpaE